MKRTRIYVISVVALLSCNGQKGNDFPKDDTIEEIEFVKGVEEKVEKESPSMYDERYGTPLDGKEAKPKDDLVKESDEDDIFGFDDGNY